VIAKTGNVGHAKTRSDGIVRSRTVAIATVTDAE
jgi:hypothetical protein